MKNIDKRTLWMNHTGSKKLSWYDIYDSEEELIRDMLDERLILYPFDPNVVRGYAYINSFRRFYMKNGFLTTKQMSQLKRLATSIAFCLYAK